MTTGNRVVLAPKGRTSMVKVLWTPESPNSLNDVHVAEELGAHWEGENWWPTTSPASWRRSSSTRRTSG